jgi:hypothetical protein
MGVTGEAIPEMGRNRCLHYRSGRESVHEVGRNRCLTELDITAEDFAYGKSILAVRFKVHCKKSFEFRGRGFVVRDLKRREVGRNRCLAWGSGRESVYGSSL